MRSFSSKSPFSFLKTNESIPLIIFIFIFLGVGLYFFINKLTEKQQQDIADKKIANEHDEVELDIVNSGNKILHRGWQQRIKQQVKVLIQIQFKIDMLA